MFSYCIMKISTINYRMTSIKQKRINMHTYNKRYFKKLLLRSYSHHNDFIFLNVFVRWYGKHLSSFKFSFLLLFMISLSLYSVCFIKFVFCLIKRSNQYFILLNLLQNTCFIELAITIMAKKGQVKWTILYISRWR